MSVPAEIRQLEELEIVNIRGKLSIEDLVRRQIDRCDSSISATDSEVFAANVRALMKHLPKIKYQDVLSKSNDYNTKVEGYNYRQTCGVNIGTPKNPFVIVPGHKEWDFWLDIPKDYRAEHEDEIDIISPTKYESTETDYEKLYEVVLQAYEGLGLTWDVERKTVEMGRVKRDAIPEWLVNASADAVVNVLIDAREQDQKFNNVTYNELVEVMRELTPPTRVV